MMSLLRIPVNAKVFIATAAVCIIGGCGGGGASLGGGVTRNAAVEWNQMALQAIRDTKPGPPIVARALAIVHTSMFDAWASYDSAAVGTRLGASLRRPKLERTTSNKQAAISFAAYRALVDLFPTEKALFDAKMSAFGYDPSDSSTNPATPAGIGNLASAAVLSFRHSDGSNQLGDLHAGAYSDTTGYQPVNTVDTIVDPNRWQPLRFSDGQGGFRVPGFIAPHWGNVTPFAVTNVSGLRPPMPFQAGTPEYLRQAQEIVDLTAGLTDEQKMIAEYWADGPKSELPPGHWCLFAQVISDRDRHTLDDDVKMFFALTNALLDSSICCWESKRFWDYCRPITAIHYLFRGQQIAGWGGPGVGTVMLSGENWKPYQPNTFITPPFPEFTSGHSTFSAASAEVLKRFSGSDSFTYAVDFAPGSSRIEPGVSPHTAVSLHWSTFSEAADMAGMSRRYGGIHFQNGDLSGRAMGRQIGDQVYDKAMTYIHGTAQ